MVGLVGFEPTTSCTPCMRATKLRYNPKMAAAFGFEPNSTEINSLPVPPRLLNRNKLAGFCPLLQGRA